MSPAPPRGGFVTATAAVSLALGGLGVASNGLQLLLAWALPPVGLSTGLLPPGAPLPPAITWLETHLAALSLAGIALSALLAVVAWGLLRRREWARYAFIAGLVLAALANFAGLPLLDPLFAGLMDGIAPPDLDPAQLQAATHTLQQAAFWACLAGAVLIAAVHGWIAWKLCRPEIRAEFRHAP
ncbi:MAG: hypothetical protein QM581_04350 [Pseudomonas sp.]